MDLDQPVATTEFLVVDTETNGLAGDACEPTEAGGVLAGGGELHERWETLLTVRTPLSRGIQRFTGITQAMVDEAPPAEAQLPALAAPPRRGWRGSWGGACGGRTGRLSTAGCCTRPSSARGCVGPTRRSCARSRSRAG